MTDRQYKSAVRLVCDVDIAADIAAAGTLLKRF